MFLWILGHIHPANLPIRSANHQHHRIFLRRQILDVARFFDLEDFASVLARFQIRIARLQLQIDALPACLPVVVFEFDPSRNSLRGGKSGQSRPQSRMTFICPS